MMSMRTSPPARTRDNVGVLSALLGIGGLTLGMYVLEGFDQASGNALDRYGIYPRSEQGAIDIFLAPWLHAGWAHLVANTVPFFVLGVLVLLEGWGRWARTTLAVVVTSGLLVWLIAPSYSVTLGASGVVFGWLTYLIARGFYTRSGRQIALGVLVFLVYGGLLLGVLPGTFGVSWQAHLGGSIGGFLAARARRHDAVRRR